MKEPTKISQVRVRCDAALFIRRVLSIAYKRRKIVFFFNFLVRVHSNLCYYEYIEAKDSYCSVIKHSGFLKALENTEDLPFILRLVFTNAVVFYECTKHGLDFDNLINKIYVLFIQQMEVGRNIISPVHIK